MTARQIDKKQKESADACPAKSLVSDLTQLRRILRKTGQAYLRHLDSEINQVETWARARSRELPKSEIRDLRDMVSLVRRIDVKPQKGRRRDVRKIDRTIRELRDIACRPKHA